MSPTTSYACSSNSYDVHSEKLLAREVKSSSSSCCPWALRHAPRTLTGSLRDQIARRGAASPLCRASSASYRVVLTQARKSSRSVMPQRLLVQRFARRDNWSISARQPFAACRLPSFRYRTMREPAAARRANRKRASCHSSRVPILSSGIRVLVLAVGRHVGERPPHPLLVRVQPLDRRPREAHQRHVVQAQGRARRVELVPEGRTSGAGARLVVGPVHDDVAQELRAALEELLERLPPLLGLELVLLLYRDPRKLAALLLGPASQLGVLGLELRELVASSLPVLPGSYLVLGHSSPSVVRFSAM